MMQSLLSSSTRRTVLIPAATRWQQQFLSATSTVMTNVPTAGQGSSQRSFIGTSRCFSSSSSSSSSKPPESSSLSTPITVQQKQRDDSSSTSTQESSVNNSLSAGSTVAATSTPQRGFSTKTGKNGGTTTTTYMRNKTTKSGNGNGHGNGNGNNGDHVYKLMGQPLQAPAGPLWGPDIVDDDNPNNSTMFIPEVPLYDGEGGTAQKRVLVLCTGGTLTMAPDPNQGGALAPVEGAISRYMQDMSELHQPGMPEYVLHEYSPFRDSSDLGPADWATLAKDIKANYLHFDGFVILMGTDTMAYTATALSFMLENLGKPVVFTGSQIPLCEPYNDARHNLIMAMIFASRDTINEVSIFFHDRLLRANRATKVNTHQLKAFDSPNMDPLATIGITIDENEHLILPPPKGALRVHTRMDTRLLTLRLVPGFDDAMIWHLIEANLHDNDRDTTTTTRIDEQPIMTGTGGGSAVAATVATTGSTSVEKRHHRLKVLVLQLYGTGNIPSVKESFIQLLADARDRGIFVVASTQCFTGNVMMGHYATGVALQEAGVVSASDMTLEAIACKSAYLFGRQDLDDSEIADLMGVSLRGEITPPEALSPPPLSSAYQRGIRKGKKYY